MSEVRNYISPHNLSFLQAHNLFLVICQCMIQSLGGEMRYLFQEESIPLACQLPLNFRDDFEDLMKRYQPLFAEEKREKS